MVKGKVMGIYERCVFTDGFSVSIQASEGNYSTPRSDYSANGYKEVELGFPSEPDELITPYSEVEFEGCDYTKTVYPYTPASVVEKLIKKHGGIHSGQCPLLALNNTPVKEEYYVFFNAEGIEVVSLKSLMSRFEAYHRTKEFNEWLACETNSSKKINKENYLSIKKVLEGFSNDCD